VRNITSQHKSYEGKPAAQGSFPALSPGRCAAPGSRCGHRPGL